MKHPGHTLNFDPIFTLIFNPSVVLDFGCSPIFDSDSDPFLGFVPYPAFNSNSITNPSSNFDEARGVPRWQRHVRLIDDTAAAGVSSRRAPAAAGVGRSGQKAPVRKSFGDNTKYPNRFYNQSRRLQNASRSSAAATSSRRPFEWKLNFVWLFVKAGHGVAFRFMLIEPSLVARAHGQVKR
ncbi:hypothetical protein EVAR_19729_1 [Eumeta japonica]|uniref:Uncharacterized protein n=1 Tax=Eumeta variegata TaxID=151549 RepID=A0A4C1UQG4_EUMVA|nr:hypothetical protein EVAR_19729_1 [Eumeta japonica]